jgi:outer membrane protein OmpA-like peptidoglycan-associated protein
MKRLYVTIPLVAALAACGASSKNVSAPQRAAEEAEQEKRDAQEQANKAREHALEERQEAQEATKAQGEAERNAQWAKQRAALAESQAANETAVQRPARSGAAERQTYDSNVVADGKAVVVFAPDSADLSGDAKAALDRIATTLRGRARPDTLVINGYADDLGAEATNVELSERRAARVAKYLETKGVSADRIATKSFGSQHPATRDTSEHGRALNRRVEVAVQPAESTPSR